jgi:hypothetical protein
MNCNWKYQQHLTRLSSKSSIDDLTWLDLARTSCKSEAGKIKMWCMYPPFVEFASLQSRASGNENTRIQVKRTFWPWSYLSISHQKLGAMLVCQFPTKSWVSNLNCRESRQFGAIDFHATKRWNCPIGHLCVSRPALQHSSESDVWAFSYSRDSTTPLLCSRASAMIRSRYLAIITSHREPWLSTELWESTNVNRLLIFQWSHLGVSKRTDTETSNGQLPFDLIDFRSCWVGH